jgi:putative transcriptional regulator
MKLATTLRRCRFDHQEMSQQQLADAVGVTRQTISSIEKSKFVPSALLALKIARYFGKTVEEIFSIEEEA